MLRKNVYIVYPAGYHGNYVKWAIEVSDLDCRPSTVLDPLNRSKSTSHGGIGTSHGHVRIPTHQGFFHHASWVIRNRPVEPMVYVINSISPSIQEFYKNIVELLLQDPAGIIIVINDGDNRVAQSYGRINCVTKWPTFLAAFYENNYEMHENFNAFDCVSDRTFRNMMVSGITPFTENAWHSPSATSQLDYDYLKKPISEYENWYKVRNQFQPHEVNSTTYLPQVDYKNRLYQINICDIPSNRFLSQLQGILTTTSVSDNFNLDVVENYHHDYIGAQPNLCWFESFSHWQLTGELDNYLQSHSIIEAEIIREIMISCHVRFDFTTSDHERWRGFYAQVSGPDWPPMPPTESGFYQLPAWVQKEIVEFGYHMKHRAEPNAIMNTLSWQNMALQDINQVYQTQVLN